MYILKSTVRYSETDASCRLKIGSLINYLQDCTTEHAQSVGFGQKYLSEIHRAWALSSWQIEIRRCPELFEKITIETRPYEFTSCQGKRGFSVYTESGEILASAYSEWVYLNTDTARPARPSDEEKAAYVLGKPFDDAPVHIKKISLPDNMTELEPIPVRPDDIDSNRHVNNSKYAEISLGLLQDFGEIKSLHIEYKRQARYNDLLYPKIGVSEDDGYAYVVLANADGKPFTVMQACRE